MSDDLPEGGEQIIGKFLQALRDAGESKRFEQERERSVRTFLQWCETEGISLERDETVTEEPQGADEQLRVQTCQWEGCDALTAQVVYLHETSDAAKVWVCEGHIDRTLEEFSPSRLGKGVRDGGKNDE